jgi:riboflavin kinase/FMN adenylyltransferase
VPFDEVRAKESAEEFVMRILVKVAATRAVVVGEDFHFGRNREGNVTMLRQIGVRHDFEVFPIELVARPDGVDEPVSSTSIRRALAGGGVEVAARLLGRPFEVRGPVVQGDQRGRLLGFPTANVEVPTAICLPADGVYAGWYIRPNGERHACAMNLGRRPTFYEHADVSLLEAHLIDFNDNLYGEQACVQFTNFLRGERKFDGVDSIMQQLKHDVDHARQVLGV